MSFSHRCKPIFHCAAITASASTPGARLPARGFDAPAGAASGKIRYWSRQPRLVLGGGSNVLLTGDFDGLVLHLCTEGIEIVGEDADATYVRAAAGENWHRFVQWTLQRGLRRAGKPVADPGQRRRRADPEHRRLRRRAQGRVSTSCAPSTSTAATIFTLDKAACAFGYRDSVFKHRWRERAVILDVTFALPKRWQPNLRYADVAQAAGGAPASTRRRRAGDQRRGDRDPPRKLPDPARSAMPAASSRIRWCRRRSATRCWRAIRSWSATAQPDGSEKLAAGWLIDQCGWKGKSLGAAGVYDKQALVLVNRGGASGAEVVRLARGDPGRCARALRRAAGAGAGVHSLMQLGRRP